MNNSQEDNFTTPEKQTTKGGTFFKNKKTCRGSFFNRHSCGKTHRLSNNINIKNGKLSKDNFSNTCKLKFYNDYYKHMIQEYQNGNLTLAQLREREEVLNVKIIVFKEPKLFKIIKKPWNQGGKITKTSIIGMVNNQPITTEFNYFPITGPNSKIGKPGDPQNYMS